MDTSLTDLLTALATPEKNLVGVGHRVLVLGLTKGVNRDTTVDRSPPLRKE